MNGKKTAPSRVSSPPFSWVASDSPQKVGKNFGHLICFCYSGLAKPSREQTSDIQHSVWGKEFILKTYLNNNVSMDRGTTKHQHINKQNSSSNSGAHLPAHEIGFYLGVFGHNSLSNQIFSSILPHFRVYSSSWKHSGAKSHSKERRFQQSSWPFGPCSLLLQGFFFPVAKFQTPSHFGSTPKNQDSSHHQDDITFLVWNFP